MIRAIVVTACAALLAALALVQSPPAIEDAYRANNLGVARLEQFDYPAAAAAFRQALEKQSDLSVARLNLAIALFYAGDLTAARREAEAAAAQLPSLPQPPYVLGLIARAENRTADAVTAFTRVREIDQDDPGAATQLGQLLLQDRKYAEATELFKRAIAAEPYNATAAYGLAMALTRAGSRDEGAAAMAQFQKLRDSAYATTYSQNYLEQGRYAGAIASTGAEPELVDGTIPKVTFADVTATVLPDLRKPGTAAGDGSATLVDLDADGDLDLIDVDSAGLRLYRNDRGRFSDRTQGASFGAGKPRSVVAGDFDNDFLPDLLVLYDDRWALFRQAKNHFEEVKDLPAVPASPRTAAWLDADHDGDLDALVGGSAAAGGAVLLARNNGDGTFTDITATAGLKMQAAVDAAAATDYDNRRDVDLLLGPQDGRPLLLRNMRDGTFRDVAADAGLTATGRVVALGDVNKDDYTDILVARAGAAALAVSDGRGRFKIAAVEAPSDVQAAQFLDYDNDGLLDLFTLTSTAPRLLRNIGSERWMDVTRALGTVPAATYSPGSLATGDVDDDGDVDAVLRPARGAPIVLRNDGGSTKRSLRVRLVARVSNRSGVGSKVEIRAGSLRQKIETSAATPAVAPADVLFGLGARTAADVVRVLWPAGILQAEIPPTPSEIALTVQELDRKPSSCPYLYTWNGERFEFITDFLGGGELGYFVAPGVRSRPDPDEYVRIDGRQLRERDGRLELRVTNELEETLFLDRAQLVAITHPAEVEVYPQEGMRAEPPPFRVHAVRDAKPPLAAIDEHGHDVLERVVRLDRRHVDDFALERIRGYAAPHHLTLRLPESQTGRRLLLLTGWTDYAFSSDNFAAHQQGLKLEPPSLQIKDAGGNWRTAIADLGIPVGRPQTVVVDLTEAVPPSVREVRVSTTMRIYWDQIRVAGSEHPEHLEHLDPVRADLRWRGFSAESTPDEPYRYDYGRVSAHSPWKLMPGRYTREGDVRPLLVAVDDMFVVARPGDEIALSFDARALSPVPAGSTRTYLLYADGFSKEMNLHSSSPDSVGPLPFHGMTSYPYGPPESYPSTRAHREYVERYNTRIVNRMLPPLVRFSQP
jgi:tetratricopeptide (TPR) repeat protein